MNVVIHKTFGLLNLFLAFFPTDFYQLLMLSSGVDGSKKEKNGNQAKQKQIKQNNFKEMSGMHFLRQSGENTSIFIWINWKTFKWKKTCHHKNNGVFY